MQQISDYDRLMQFLVQVEQMKIAKPGVYTGLLKQMEALKQEEISDCEAMVKHLQEKAEVLEAENANLTRDNAWYKQRYGPATLKTYSKKSGWQ